MSLLVKTPHKRQYLQSGLVAAMLLLLTMTTGCATSVAKSPSLEYLSLAPTGTFNPADKDPRLKGFTRLLGNFDATTMDNEFEQVYAEDIYFNDTFHTFRSGQRVKRYFLSLTENAQTNVEFLDAASMGDDALVRWKMRMQFAVWGKEIDSTSIGITHLRFNDEGKIIMHQDYWDGVDGFYSHLPILGSVIRYVRGRLGDIGA